MTDELEKIIEDTKQFPEAEPFVPSEELRAAVAKAITTLKDRPYSERHSELGKMIKCHVHGFRHREFEFGTKPCEQVFTYRGKNKHGKYAMYREDERGEEVPDYRTAVRPDEKPTKKQLIGAAQFAKKRFHPHYSRIKLMLIERTRVVYPQLKWTWNLIAAPVSKLQRARVIAARQIRKEREIEDRQKRRRADQSRRINRGLRLGRNRA